MQYYGITLNKQKMHNKPNAMQTLLFLFILMTAMFKLFFLLSSFFCRLMVNRTARTLKFENKSTIYLLVSGNNLSDVNLCREDSSKHFICI